jgi:hypothetical protein
MVLQRITIYGWVINKRGVHAGDYALVDLVYFIKNEYPLSEPDIFRIIERVAGTRIIPKYIENNPNLLPESDKVIVEEWGSHVTAGAERIEEIETQKEYDRFNFPEGEGII